ncbi:hypothetical protein [Weissella bombi]|uniref:Extracellular protein n=1 Tax=Weissella bombi TaxID=1505725 RepID=A0A1C3Z809_9LACO|nr:hypothetical protein [Weissella bombi]SCB78557.1 hypothetical protein GA0061074_101360 [Weissella bombi]
MILFKKIYLIVIAIIMSSGLAVQTVYGETIQNLTSVNLKQDIQLQTGSDEIKGTINNSQSTEAEAYMLVVKNKQETLLKQTVVLNQAFEARLNRKLKPQDQITIQLEDQNGTPVIDAAKMALTKWRVLNRPTNKVKTSNWGNVFQNSRIEPKKYQVVQAPKTGLSYLKKPHYIASRREVTTFKENDRSVNNTIKGYQTALLLPTRSTNLVNWQLPQGSVMHNQYLYVMYESQEHKSYGRIVRYDIGKLKQLGVWQNGQDNLRQLEQKVNQHNFATTTDEQLLQTIVIGPEFYMGHGQAVSFNKRYNQLWLVSLTKKSRQQQLTQVDLNTLYPKERHNFIFKDTKNKQSFHGEHNLSIDDQGNVAMVGMISDKTAKQLAAKNVRAGDLMLYHGYMQNGRLRMAISNTVVRQKPGYFGQFLAVKSQTKQLFYLSDGVYYALPADKWADGTLNQSDINSGVYTESYNTREFESQGWDSQGNAYLIVNRGAEVMQETK